jgi:hypothetical protein
MATMGMLVLYNVCIISQKFIELRYTDIQPIIFPNDNQSEEEKSWI